MLLPGSTIGMLGGGQLGRMFTVAARTMGYRVIVLEPDPLSPTGQLANEHLIAAYDDEKMLHALGKRCDVITTEFENIPAQTLELLTQFCPVRPSAGAVKIAQDRIVEKEFVTECGLSPVPYATVRKISDIAEAAKDFSFPAIMKTARLGYDGKGQIVVHNPDEALAAFNTLKQVDCVLEQRVELACEISVILARNEAGESDCFPVAENIHRHGILHQTIVPARVAAHFAQSAQEATRLIADKLAFIGVMAIEFFVTKQGELLINEMAPRTHNSGHYTIDACLTSQFEQQVRMVCDLPFGNSALHTPVIMTNLLGDVWGEDKPDWQSLLARPENRLHLYGKHEARPGRKMGHFCTLHQDLPTAITSAEQVFKQLEAAAAQTTDTTTDAAAGEAKHEQ